MDAAIDAAADAAFSFPEQLIGEPGSPLVRRAPGGSEAEITAAGDRACRDVARPGHVSAGTVLAGDRASSGQARARVRSGLPRRWTPEQALHLRSRRSGRARQHRARCACGRQVHRRVSSLAAASPPASSCDREAE
jgi:hypothetical protein